MAMRSLLSTIFPDHCVSKILDHQSYFDIKVPQVIKILQNRSGAGLSILSLLLELLTFTVGFAYSLSMQYPFSSYGESTFLLFQTFVILWLVLSWEVSQMLGILFAATYGAGLAISLSPMMPHDVLLFFQALSVPIMLSSKFLQIVANWRNGSTGQLSAITLCLFALGSTARIFTSIQETGDNLIILSYVLSTLCNYILMAQLFYYWRSPLKTNKKKKQQQQQKTKKQL